MATASVCEGPRALANHPDETPHAGRTSRGRRVRSQRKRLENERVAEKHPRKGCQRGVRVPVALPEEGDERARAAGSGH